jgi:hypothetical protein
LVAVGSGVTAGMPTRPYSAAILGGLWPTTSPDGWSDIGDALLQKSNADSDTASTIMRSADSLLDENSGRIIEAMHTKYMGDRLAVVDQSDTYRTMSEVVDQVAQLIYHARARLDDIDREANEEIERLKKVAASHKGAYVMAMHAIAAVVASAKAAALEECTKCAGEIFAQGVRIGVKPPEPPTDAPSTLDPNEFKGLGGGSIRDGMPTGLPLGKLPEAPPSTDPPKAPGDKVPTGPGTDPEQSGPPSPKTPGDHLPGQPGTDGPTPTDPKDLPPLREHMPVERGLPTDSAPQAIPAAAAVPLSPGQAGRGGMSSFGSGSPGGMGGGLGMPSSGLSGGSGMGAGGGGGAPSLGSSMANPAAGLTSPAAGGVPGTPPTNDFAKGFGSGFNAAGGSASMLPPPAASAPPPTSGAPTGGMAGGPAPISSTAGPPPTAAPAAVSSPGGAPMAPMAPMVVPPPAGGGGPLPPFGSDIPRQAAVTPAAGPPISAPAPAVPPPVASAPVAPLPPGVVASGVGAAAAGAGLGVRSTAPDPLLQSASALIYQLMHASRLYAAIDWCVGVFKTPSGIETVVVSSEGCGFIPTGVVLPRSARMLFSDPNVGNGFRSRWFSWVNPAQTMLAYAASCGEYDPNIELWALAVSTDNGGSAVPARDAGIRHYEDCSLMVSPIPADAPAAALDQLHVHRLETIDRAEYSRVTGAAGQGRPERSETWATTLAAVQTALARASNLLGFSVPPVIRHTTSALGNGEPVTDEQWNDLELVRLNATLDSASQRPGRTLDSDGVTSYGRAYHNLARTAELLGMWRGVEPQAAEIAYTARQITGEAALWPERVGE